MRSWSTPCASVTGNVPADEVGFKWACFGWLADRTRLLCPASDPTLLPRCQVMNIRAAEAIVSSAPNPMKIFPIRVVWSQTELSLVIVVAGAGGGLAVA